MNNSDVLTIDEAAKFLKIHKNTAKKLAEAKKLPAKKVGRQWRFTRAGLEAFLNPPDRRKAS